MVLVSIKDTLCAWTLAVTVSLILIEGSSCTLGRLN